MAEISVRAVPVYQDGDCFKTALFSVKNATSGDTVDLAGWFAVVKRAGVVSATGTTIAVAAITNNASGQPTLATMPTGIAADGVWLLVVGVDS